MPLDLPLPLPRPLLEVWTLCPRLFGPQQSQDFGVLFLPDVRPLNIGWVGVDVKVEEIELDSLLMGVSALARTRAETLFESKLEVGLTRACSVLTAGGGAVAEAGKGSADVVFIGEVQPL